MFNRQLFSASLDTHITSNKLSLRDAAKQCGVSASTLSRLLRGETPDMDSFGLLCDWMCTRPGVFFVEVELLPLAQQVTPLALVASALRSDEALPDKAREKLVELVKAAYSCLTERSST